MPHKVHPKIFRTNIIRTWDSRWFARKQIFAVQLKNDILVREFLMKELREAGIDAAIIERNPREVVITIIAAKPGFIIGRGGAGAEELRKKIQKKFFNKETVVKLNITELSRPSLSARVILDQMATDLERRMPFRRVMKSAIDRVEKAGAQGIKVRVSGRLNGAEIARTEKLSSGKIPLTTLRADVDFAQGIARTIYGVIGVTVWIYRGEIFTKEKEKEALAREREEVKASK